MKRRPFLVLCCLIVAACRTTHVGGPSIAPLALSDSPLEALHARAAAFDGARSIMRVRLTSGGETRTFRAQLVVPDRNSMRFIAYTPVGTTAATIRAEGDHVSVTDARTGSTTEGNAADMLRPYGFYTGGLTPAEMGLLLLGYPPRRDLMYEAAQNGLSRASAGDVVVTFDPPALPAQRVIVMHGTDRVEIEHLEVAAMK
ncbi:MAG TPA: hypothetical protein VLV78_01525 [Thermoanaerobaculia bacterium]|nr:hypothetical protein [Thermoanaerobaculia bacterium]